MVPSPIHDSKDVYKKKHIASDFVTFEQVNWSTEIVQPSRNFTQVTSLVPCLHIKVDKEGKSKD